MRKLIVSLIAAAAVASALPVSHTSAVELDASTRSCLEKLIGKSATNSIAKAKKLTAAQTRNLAKCQPGAGGSSASPGGEPWYWGWNWDTPTALPRNPACTEAYPLKLNPAPIESYVSLNRLGFTQPGAHAMPVPHHNISTRDLRGSGTVDENGHLLVSERVDPIKSPANLTIIGLARNVYGRNVTTNETFTYEEWMIAAHVCGTKYVVFNHIDNIPASWVKATEAASVHKECNVGQDNASVCMYANLSIPVKQGDRIGRASGRSAGWDIGGWDTSRPAPGVMDPSKYTGRWAMGACVWDWFTPSIKAEVFQKFVGDKTTCGTTGFDVANTLSGTWLAIGKRNQAFIEDLHVALIPAYTNDGFYRFSIGYNSNIASLPGGVYQFAAETSGLHNPKFDAVGPGQVACFDSFVPNFKMGDGVTRIYASMTPGAIEKLTIAGDGGGSCGSAPYTMPSGAATFERSTRVTG